MRESGRVRLAFGDTPRRPADKAVDGVLPLGLVEGQLVSATPELVAPVLDPVRPRDQQLATAARCNFVRFVAVDHGAAVGDVGVEARTDFDDDGALIPGRELDLLAGRSDWACGLDQVRMPRQTIRAIHRAPAILAGVSKSLLRRCRRFLTCICSGS